MRILYNILFQLAFVLASPYYFWRMRRRGNWQKGFSQRFGYFDAKVKQALTNRHTVWMHAVSVGEVNICTQVIAALEPRLPNLKFVVSTTTTTGMEELQKRLPTHVTKIYYPVDARRAVRRALLSINPRAIVLVEAEIWPNFLWQAAAMRVPVFLVNARLSDRSYQGYKRLGFLFRRFFAGFAGVGAQNQADADRLVSLGCNPAVVKVVGSLKFDSAKLDERHVLDIPALLRAINVPEDAPILLGGSTHDGEEEILGRIYLRLKERIPGLFLILVPRHFERSRDVGRKLQEVGLKFAYRKDIAPGVPANGSERLDCLVVNTTGELRHFYRHATVIFVGKSLAAHGGQNPIEPGALGKPMVFGPYMENFRDIAASFVSSGGALQAQNEASLESAICELLQNSGKREDLGRRASEVVRQNRGGLERTVDMIVERLDDGEIYVAPKR